MKISLLIAPFVVILAICLKQSIAEPPHDFSAKTSQPPAITQKIIQLADTCHQRWQVLDWTVGQQNILARNNPAFTQGIKNICRARAELFFEGYEISPFIAQDSQNQVFPIVFRYSVQEIKAQLRLHLPKLRLI